jgi:hypothetical protein
MAKAFGVTEEYIGSETARLAGRLRYKIDHVAGTVLTI